MKQDTKVTQKIVEEHGLSPDEYRLLKKSVGRDPNITELGIFSVMWSEHCSYKSSRAYLKEFPTKGPCVLQGPGENAGIIDIGDGMAIAFKIESHNHPSFIEPYQGAATGVGGILRDIFTMGARPIANLNSLRFGAIDAPRMAYLVRGVVGGIGGYGNTMGIPTVGGEVFFDECYNGNILVNAFTLGIMDARRIFRGKAGGVGNPVIYVGSKTGRDGIHGATMASDEFDETSEERRPTVQVGDPFTEKLLLEACLELMSTDAIVGIQDMGAAGLTCSTFEMASRGRSGMEIDLDKVPLRETGMTPYEIMLSESQERMLMVVQKGRENDVKRIFEKWDLNCAVIGSVTNDGKVKVRYRGENVVELPVAPVVQDAPLYERPAKEPSWQREVQKLDIESILVPRDLNDVLIKLMTSPNLTQKAWVWEQYDHMVMTNTALIPGSDAAVLRLKNYIPTAIVREGALRLNETKKGLALTCDCNSRYCYLDPWMGSALAVAEAARNISCTGAAPMAVTDCLNYGNPEKPEIMWQFIRSVEGIAEACRQFETPVVGGNVSFYNETKGNAIYPTPVIAMVGLLDDVDKHCTPWFKDEKDVVILLGKSEAELGGSEYLKQIHGKTAGLPPQLDFKREKAVQKVCRVGISRGFIKSAHDVSDGGLAVALAECALLRPDGLQGAVIEAENDIRPDVFLFGESASRIIVTVAPENIDMMLTIAKAEGVFARVIGNVGGRMLVVGKLLSIDLADLYEKWSEALPKLLGEGK
jgi:phosphoribosylformylglycinamidine synthase